MEGAGCGIGLAEIVIKEPLFAAELERVRAMHPVHTARIVEKRVGKGRVHATLGKESSVGSVIHDDRRHACQAVCNQNGWETHSIKIRVIRFTRRFNSIEACSKLQQK